MYVELVIGFTVRLPLAGRVCGRKFVADQNHRSGVLRRPRQGYRVAAAVEVTGSAVNDRILTAPTLTVTLAWIWPVALVAVRV